MNKKCEKKVPKKIHKSEREKRKRGTQNDLFNELGAMLGMCISYQYKAASCNNMISAATTAFGSFVI